MSKHLKQDTNSGIIIRTLGRVSARLITALYDNNKPIFTIKDAREILGKSYYMSVDILSRLTRRKVIARLKAGKYIIIPQELGSQTEYIGNYYVAGREIINSKQYYIAFYSAMHHWGMLTQPLLKVFICSSVRQVVPKDMKDKITIVYIKKHFGWGIQQEWVTKTEKVKMSDLERTIIDGLAHPEYCGGITEVAKGMWLVKDKIDYDKLVDYAEKYGKKVVAKRLGYLIETIGMDKPSILAKLLKQKNLRYDVFDPTIPCKTIDKNRWHLLDNIGRQQIRSIIWH